MKIPKTPIALALLVATAGPLTAREAEANAQQAAEVRSEIERVREQVENEKERVVEAARAAAESQRTLILAQAGKPVPGAPGAPGAPAAPGKGPNPPAFSSRVSRVIYKGGGSMPALIIPKDADDAKNMGELQEDLNIMDHIIDKAIGSSKNPQAMGIWVLGQGSGNSQNLYIEGHGAILFANVNFPLLPPPAKDKPADTKEPSEWDEARREIAHPGKGDEPFADFEGWSKGPVVEYNSEKVEDLKKNLISALKNAANIRKLKSDETITIVITGTLPQPVKMREKNPGESGSGSGGGGSGGRIVERDLNFSSGSAHSSSGQPKLVIRAKKSDAEAFQNGKLDFDGFRKKVTVMLY